ncbi:maestro heat-like repeat family member 5 [Sceloporus undulatus]|uniref:maestro heat-like repeat family member 5 n=1 Tax=Sceloporus undulatus TaxID=8520 RepID=UPI001C4D5E7C|nr:maestro heat-like repeat family member 5 [Sceloporus undulatus]
MKGWLKGQWRNGSIFKRTTLDKRNRRRKKKAGLEEDLNTAAFSENDAVKSGTWERKQVKAVKRRLIGIIEETQRRGGQEELAEENNSQDLEKASLYEYYGSILRASNDSQLVQEHLHTILSLAYKGPLEVKGIASALGLAATRHLQDVLKVLENFNEKALENNDDDNQGLLLGTLLFCYGHVAMTIGDQVLPVTDAIASKMITILGASPLDKNLKRTFLVVVLMLLEAIVVTGKAQSLELLMKGPLVECLIFVLEEEPSCTLDDRMCQDSMLIMAELRYCA